MENIHLPHIVAGDPSTEQQHRAHRAALEELRNPVPPITGDVAIPATWPKKESNPVNQQIPVSISPAALAKAQELTGSGFKAPAVKKEKRTCKHYNNDGWAEVTQMHSACSDLLRSSLALTPLLKVPELLACIDNKPLLNRLICGITRDTLALSNELKANSAYVEKLRNKCKDVGEVLSSAQSAFQHYVNFMERFDSALFPFIEHASELLQVGLNRLAAVEPEIARQLDDNMRKVLGNIGAIVRDTIGSDKKVA